MLPQFSPTCYLHIDIEKFHICSTNQLKPSPSITEILNHHTFLFEGLSVQTENSGGSKIFRPLTFYRQKTPFYQQETPILPEGKAPINNFWLRTGSFKIIGFHHKKYVAKILPLPRDVPSGGRGGGGVMPPMSANFKKIGHAAGTLTLIRKFDQISTCNSFILLVNVAMINFLFCNTLFL